MKKKTKKRLIIWACVLVILGTVGFFGYQFALEYLGEMAIRNMVKSEISSMLDSGEMTIEEIEEIIAPPESVEVTGENKLTVTKPTVQNPPKSRQEVVEEAVDKVTEGISREDKREIMRLIGARLTMEDINTLMAIAKDGRLSAKEVDVATKIAYARFTPEEMKKVKGFWHKYKDMTKKKS